MTSIHTLVQQGVILSLQMLCMTLKFLVAIYEDKIHTWVGGAYNTMGTPCHLHPCFYLPATFWWSSEDPPTRSWTCERRWWDNVYDSPPAFCKTHQDGCAFLFFFFFFWMPSNFIYCVNARNSTFLYLPSWWRWGASMSCLCHSWMDRCKSSHLWFHVLKVHHPRSPLWPGRCSNGELISNFTCSMAVSYHSHVEFWKVSQVLLQQSAWHTCWSSTL